jgi:hypothetical protein
MYDAPGGEKIVKGLTSLPSDYTATFELRDSSGVVVGTATASNFDYDSVNNYYYAWFYFYAPVVPQSDSVTLMQNSPYLQLPAGTYTLVETSTGTVPGKTLSTTYTLTVTGDPPVTTATNQVTINSDTAQYGIESYYFTVTNTYSTPYTYDVYHTLTVHWVDDQGNALADPVTRTYVEGAGYNANDLGGGSGRTFTDYTYSSSSGNDVTGYMNTDKDVTFIYNPVITPETPPLVDIPDEPTGLDASPKTGDSSMIALLWLTFCASFCGLVVLGMTVPKKRREDR